MNIIIITTATTMIIIVIIIVIFLFEILRLVQANIFKKFSSQNVSLSLWNCLYTEVMGLQSSGNFGNFSVNIKHEDVVTPVMSTRRSSGLRDGERPKQLLSIRKGNLKFRLNSKHRILRNSIQISASHSHRVFGLSVK